jgi:hypothetical protein
MKRRFMSQPQWSESTRPIRFHEAPRLEQRLQLLSSRLDRPPSLNYTNQHDYDRKHQQDVDQAGGRVSGGEAEGPED